LFNLFVRLNKQVFPSYNVNMMEDQITQQALELHNRLTVVDCHCDTILEVARGRSSLCKPSHAGHVDVFRMREGGVKVQFFAAYIEPAYKPYGSLTRALQLIDTFYSETEAGRDIIVPGFNLRQIRNKLKEDKIVAILGIEGGEVLNGELAVLRVLYRLGVRFLGLTWNQRNQLADGVGERITGGGLTNFGREVVKEMNRLGMIIDLAHISEAGFWNVLELSRDPVMVSHANCYGLCSHPRNLSDDQIKALAERGGVMGLSFVPDFLGSGRNGIEVFLDHVDFVAGLAGTQVIAIGSDFDGIEKTPEGLEDSRCYPVITRGLLERGYTDKEVTDIMGGNVLRFMEQVFKN